MTKFIPKGISLPKEKIAKKEVKEPVVITEKVINQNRSTAGSNKFDFEKDRKEMNRMYDRMKKMRESDEKEEQLEEFNKRRLERQQECDKQTQKNAKKRQHKKELKKKYREQQKMEKLNIKPELKAAPKNVFE